jgi:hypothetical protein
MKVTIENVKEMKKGWVKTYPVHVLYVTLDLTNEEKFIIENNFHLGHFTLVQGMKDPNDGKQLAHKPAIYAGHLLIRPFMRDKINGTAQRLRIFENEDIKWANYNQDLLEQGLKKWKEAIDALVSVHEKRPEKKTLEL